MIPFKCVLVLFVLQVLGLDFSTGHFLFSQSLRDHPLNKISPFDLNRHLSRFKRGRRCLGTALTLLWPQVVGPVDQGVIKESDFQETPKTPLEYKLDLLRKKAKEEEEERLTIRSYLKSLIEAQDEFYGFSPYKNSVSEYT